MIWNISLPLIYKWPISIFLQNKQRKRDCDDIAAYGTSGREEMIELDHIYNEDCLEGMRRMPDGRYYETAVKRVTDAFAN